MNIKEFLKKNKKGLIIGAVGGMILGLSFGVESPEQAGAISKANELSGKVSGLEKEITTLKGKNEELEGKVKEAEPWFKMEKEKRDEEVRKKEDAKKKEEAKKEAERKKKGRGSS